MPLAPFPILHASIGIAKLVAKYFTKMRDVLKVAWKWMEITNGWTCLNIRFGPIAFAENWLDYFN